MCQSGAGTGKQRSGPSHRTPTPGQLTFAYLNTIFRSSRSPSDRSLSLSLPLPLPALSLLSLLSLLLPPLDGGPAKKKTLSRSRCRSTSRRRRRASAGAGCPGYAPKTPVSCVRYADVPTATVPKSACAPYPSRG